MKKLSIIFLSAFAISGFHNISAELNNFEISNLIPPKNVSFAADNHIFHERITEEMGEFFTLQDILKFITKIEKYIDYLLDTNNLNPENILLAQLAVIDVGKAKKMLKSNEVDAQTEHDLRLALMHIDARVQSLTAQPDSFQE